MLKLKALIVAGLMLTTPALAQDVPSGVSDDGKQVYVESMKQRAAGLTPLLARKRELQAQFDAMLTPEAYDEEKLAATMADMRGVEAQIVEKMGASLLAMLKAFPENDRAIFLRSLSKTPTAKAASTEKSGEGR